MRNQTRTFVGVAHQTDDLDAVEISRRIGLARSWGYQEVRYIKVYPCRWQDCGGSVLVFDREPHCLVCARPPVDGAAAAPLPLVRNHKTG